MLGREENLGMVQYPNQKEDMLQKTDKIMCKLAVK